MCDPINLHLTELAKADSDGNVRPMSVCESDPDVIYDAEYEWRREHDQLARCLDPICPHCHPKSNHVGLKPGPVLDKVAEGVLADIERREVAEALTAKHKSVFSDQEIADIISMGLYWSEVSSRPEGGQILASEFGILRQRFGLRLMWAILDYAKGYQP